MTSSGDGVIEPQPQDKEWFKRKEWLSFHESLVRRSARRRDTKVVFLGDSITQGWLTTGFRHWQKTFSDYQPLNLGIGGDEIQHLHWRLLNGEGDDSHPDVVVLLVGTNNIGNAGHSAEQVIELFEPLLDCIGQKWPSAAKLVHTIFPRDANPGTPFRKSIADVNAAIHSWATSGRFSVLDMTEVFLRDDGTLPQDDLPDFLHLSERAYGIWAGHLDRAIQRVRDKE